MDARILIATLAFAGTLGAGCEKQSKLYCGKHPTDLENCGFLDAGIDARPTCTTDPDCAGSPAAPFCEPNTHYCVECYLPEHCAMAGTEQYCDLDRFSCTSCVAHANCASKACLPSGECGEEAAIAYVDPAAPAGNTECTLQDKCSTIAAALVTKRPFIKLQGDIVEAVPAINTTAVTLLAEPGTTLTRPNGGVVLAIAMGSEVAIYDLAITGNDDKGITVDKSTLRLVRSSITGCNHKDRRAIEAKGSTLIVSRSSIHGNTGGGITTDSATTFNITNTFIVRNGADDATVGGASLGAASSGLNRFEMNTVVDNRVTATANAGGLHCAASLPAPNNVVARNYAGGLTGLANSNRPGIGGCSLDKSIVATDITPYRFVMPEGTGPWDYHLQPGSSLIDSGFPSDLTTDIDGDARPYSAMVDLGADEYAP